MEDLIIGKRIQELLKGKCTTQRKLAAAVGVHPNVVSYWCNDSRTPNAEQIVNIAKHFGVTTDYVLGLSDVETPNQDVQTICRLTGLSEQSVNNLIRIMKENDSPPGREAVAVNTFLASWSGFDRLVGALCEVMNECEQARDYLSESDSFSSGLAQDFQTGKIIDRMELSFFKADESFRDAISKAFGYRQLIDDLRNV